jgi:hypothetical protein
MPHRRAVHAAIAAALLALPLASPCAGGTLPLPATGSNPPAGPVTVEATGRGETARAARQDAIVAALRQIVGEYIEADVQLADEEVVRNEILSFSNAGGVRSEQVGEPRVVGDEFEVVMRVTVEPRPLVERVRGTATAEARLDGAALAAELAAAKDDFAAKQRVLEKLFENLPDAFMTIRIVDSEGKDTRGFDRKLVRMDRASGQATIVLPIVLGFDAKAWREQVYPAIEQVLVAAADARLESAQVFERTASAQIPLTGTPTSLSTRVSRVPQIAPNKEAIFLLRENLGRGRQLVFDMYTFEQGLLPFVDRRAPAAPRLRFPARTLRVRFADSDGSVVDGGDLRLAADIFKRPANTFMLASVTEPFGPPLFVTPTDHGGPGRSDGVVPWLAAPTALDSGMSRLYLSPMWMHIPVDNPSNPTSFSPELILQAVFTLPIGDLEQIERITAELVRTP